MAARRIRVFVSSTYLDNKSRRQLVEQAIRSAGMEPVGMERFEASTHTPVEVCLEKLADCDLLVGILAWRYGWTPEGSSKSITELEYDAARERLMFLAQPTGVRRDEDMDEGRERWAKQAKAQWEYACRAGTDTRYWSGDNESDLERVGWFTKNSGGALQSVGRKPANPFGLYDMHGNVWEWCADWYGKYSKSPQQDPAGAAGGSVRVFRGGFFRFGADWCRSAFRFGGRPSVRGSVLGFRVALPAAPSST